MVAGGDDRDSKLTCFLSKKLPASLLAALPFIVSFYDMTTSVCIFGMSCISMFFCGAPCAWETLFGFSGCKFPDSSLSPHASRGLKCVVSRRLR